ncbi:DUF2269 family protein [Paenibacillus ginsengarvi]|nr:DUF2269 family protein [Paenibacillus ginsengarvi]
MKQKKLLVTAHLIFSAIMLGGMVIFLVLSITAATTNDPRLFESCFAIMRVLAQTSVRASTIGTVVTGVLLSVWTHWGLLRYYWIIAKELLTLVAIGIGIVGIGIWSVKTADLSAAQGMDVLHDAVFRSNRNMLVGGIVCQIVSLAAIFVLSVYKPWGKRARA